MYIATERLVIRDLVERDAEALLQIKYDGQVMKYHPTFFDGINGAKADLHTLRIIVAYFVGLSAKGALYDEAHPQRGSLSAVCRKDSGEVIGVITLNLRTLENEWHIGWYFLGQHTGKGYASEAGAAVSDYFLGTGLVSTLYASVRGDNPASFRTAQKSGFTLIEKRIGLDPDRNDCNRHDFHAVRAYYDTISNDPGSYAYYFVKRRPEETQTD